MAGASVMTAVRTRLGETYAGYPVRYPNESTETPADGSPFWVVQYPVANEEQITIGAPTANVFRETGAIRLVLQIPRGQDVVPYVTIVDQARALFRGAQFSGVNCYAPSPAVLDDRNDDGNYWALATAVPYYADLRA